ncbi:pseudouridine synthase [Mycena amicta]|nr:pseudouridine synthase [Mycena amicta]
MTYESWSKQELIAKLVQLESPVASTVHNTGRPFDFSSYPRRKIALKFCYSGWEYNGLAIQADPTPLPTVEGVLFDALAKARLIDGDAGMDGCEWERCGRTDRGVSAAGQVVSLWPEAEHNFPSILNRLLPSTIRVLAWSPVDPSFSSRFACTSRHYKYFFSPSLDGLDVPKMQQAAHYLLGSHDFRNFCKIDPAKQLTEYRRRILRADISPVSNSNGGAGMYVLDLVGSAFLYHQVRHIMAVLFLVGAALEDPSIVPTLLNVAPNAETEQPLPVVDTRPEYQMADGLPLMLYACHYPPGLLDWQVDTNSSKAASAQKHDPAADADAFAQLQYALAKSQMYATVNSAFCEAAEAHHVTSRPTENTIKTIPLGGASFRRTSKYVPLLQRHRNDHFEVVNARWRAGKGARKEGRRVWQEGHPLHKLAEDRVQNGKREWL